MPPRRPVRKAAPRRAKTATGVRALERRLARLTAGWKAERQRYERRLAAERRETDRRLAGMMSEIAALRHHEARAEALARLLAERDAVLAAQAERLARLEALLQDPTALG